MDIDWPVEFGTWLDRLETDARAGDERATSGARTVLVFVDGVAARADPLVDQWKRETAYEEKP